MFAMIRQFFAMFSSLFSAGEKLANAASHAASFVEGEASGFNERTSLVRSAEMNQLRSKYTLEDRKLAAADALSARDLEKSLQALVDSKPEPSATTPAPSALHAA